MTIAISITKRVRRRVQVTGNVAVYTRYVLNFRDPYTGKRRQLFANSHRQAIARRDALVAAVATKTYADTSNQLTVKQAVEHWLENRRTEVKGSTWKTYRQVARPCIIGPLLIGTSAERKTYIETGTKPEGTCFADMLGPTKIGALTTSDIRRWHQTLQVQVGGRAANMAKTMLGAALALAAEDFGLRPPPMPTKLGRGRPKRKRAMLTPEQVGVLLKAARTDRQRGIYYAWPFLTGTRPSEQLGLLWEDVDFERGLITIRRMQERSGELVEATKSSAGMRELPLSPTLRTLLTEWRRICPRKDGALHRVFPGPQGGALTYWNWRARYFKPALIKLGLPYVTPHSARHGFISALQAKGIEVGLVAKLAGHANAAVTLSHYTQAVRGGEAAMRALEEAYAVEQKHA